MKSTDVYAAAREVLAPWCKEQGFRRTKSGVLGWYRPADGGFVTFWLQCAQVGWDYYAGSQFTVEFQHAETAGINQPTRRRKRFYELLTDAQLAEVRASQNRVIARLIRPPQDYFVLKMEPRYVASYLRYFEPVTEEYTGRADLWLRYHDADDVRMWAHFLVAAMPGMLAIFLGSVPE